jgi:triphosphoribosyl-dephospho-CoA synthetase
VEAMDRESNMSEEDMEMRNFFKSTSKIHPSLKRAPG